MPRASESRLDLEARVIRPFASQAMIHGNLAAVEATRAVPFSTAGVKVFRRDYASSYGWWGNVAIVVGRRPPEAAHVVNYRACVVELHKPFPQGVGLITIVNDTSTHRALLGNRERLHTARRVTPLTRARTAASAPSTLPQKSAITALQPGF